MTKESNGTGKGQKLQDENDLIQHENDLSRRGFFKTGAAAGVAAGVGLAGLSQPAQAQESELSHALLGTWKLVRWYNEGADGSVTEPFGPTPVGFISYTEDGHIFAHLAVPDRARFRHDDMALGTPAEDSAAMKSYVSYAGTYEIGGDDVVHHVALASFPNWTGSHLRRSIHFEDGRLRLSTEPFAYRGVTIVAHVIWERPTIE